MLKKEAVTLDGYVYNIQQLPLRPARALLLRLTNLLGPALGDAVIGDGSGVSIDGTSIGSAIKTLAASLGEDDFVFVQDSLFAHITWTNDQGHEVPLKEIAEEHFGGEGLGRLLKLIFEALKVNYADFLKGLGLDGLIQANPPPGSLQN